MIYSSRTALVHEVNSGTLHPGKASACVAAFGTVIQILGRLQLYILCASFLLLSGCSMVRIAYNQADTLLAWMAHDYFDLDAAQRHDLSAHLDPLLKWHRQEQLPEYARFLGEIKQRGQRTITPEDATWIIEGAKARYRIVAQKGAQDATELLMTLTPDNIRALEKSFDKVNQKFVREYKLEGPVEARKRARLERTLKLIREWSGSLTHAQEARIAALNDAIPSADHLRQQDRQRRQKEFLALLNARQNKAEFSRALRTWLTDWEKNRPAELDAALNDVNEKRVALYLEVEHMLTPQQRTHVLQKIQDYIDDVNALMARGIASR